MNTETLIAKPEEGYALIDSGLEEKLERYGDQLLLRPDPQALWEKKLPSSRWREADGWYERKGKSGEWHTGKDFPKEWTIPLGGFTFLIRPTTFKHTGLFPEQLPNWAWITENTKQTENSSKPLEVLNLFAYTGGATLGALRSGASVTHVDASKTAVSWAKKNAELSGFANASVRWIVDDVMTFLGREVKRGNTYDAIIMDPPAFGHGPKDELWKIEEHYVPLIALCQKLLTPKPRFVLASGYAAGYSSLAFGNSFEPFGAHYGGNITAGELTIEEEGSGRLLPAGIFARWTQ